ncbi:MAG TPA: ABC transporter permease [Candidatus Acidoferrum sp.]|nr:ABC transporter permease [Candidatus Acidoferrum sp.]
MGTLMQDVKFGLRMLAKNRSFTLIAVLTLALGIGANTAMFSVVNAVLLRPLPFPQPDRLVTIWGTHSKLNESKRALSYPDIADLQSMNSTFESVAAYDQSSVTLTGVGEPLHLNSARVNANMFSLLRASPILGRGFAPGDDNAGNYLTVLSHSLWQGEFHGDPNVIGRSVAIDGRSYTIIGVMPAGFAFPLDSDPPKLWTTYSGLATPVNGEKPGTEERGSHFLAALARLKPGVTMEQADQDTQLVGQRLSKTYSDTNKYLGLRAVPALQALVGDVQPQLYILLGAVGLVLLIGCANVANLLLARATGRQREIAIRAAMGASRGRIVRQLLIESGILAIAGGACGLVVAVWGTALFSRLAADQIPRLAGASLDGRVLAFTLAASILTGIVFGLAPALQLSRLELTETLKESGRGAGQSSRQNRLRSLLVASEMTLAVILLTGAGLLIKSLSKLENVNPGFNPHGVISYSVDLPDSRYPKSEQAERFFQQLYERVRAIPGVESASGTVPLPLSGDTIRTSYEIEGRPLGSSDTPHVHFRAVGLDYFRTMGIPLLQGRDFNAGDQAGKPDVIIVNKELVAETFPGENPIGKRIKPGIGTDGKEHWREIVGVAGDVKHQALDRGDTPECYVPEEQIGFGSMSGVVRTSLPPTSLIPAIREQVRAIDKDVPVYGVKTMDDYVAESVALPRLDSTLLGIFAGLALLLAVVGIYGVMSYGVAQRTSEIGIRMTLGAQRADVLRLVLSQGLGIAIAGVGIGIVGALGATQLLSKMLFGVSPGDPLTFAAVAVTLVVCALAACYIPAWRATKVDPMVALRYE